MSTTARSARFRRSSCTVNAGVRPLHVEPLEDRRMLAGRAADAINAFAFDVYEHLQREQGNLFFSPLSIATALAMTYAGAAGDTAAQFEDVLHLGSEPGIHESFQQLLSSLNAQSSPGGPQLEAANAIWPAQELPVRQSFVDVVEGNYDGYVQTVDYSSPSAAEAIINDWVADHTHQKILDLVQDLSPATAMVLTNALYFKGSWENQFKPEFTGNGFFTRSDGSIVAAPLMHTMVYPDIAVTGLGEFTVAELPFAAGTNHADLSMIVALPSSYAIEDGVTADLYAQIESTFSVPYPYETFFDVTLPKFNISTSTKLTELLVGLGISDAFDPGLANFSGMTPAGVSIDTVFHKATLDVNERGVEASAATEVALVTCFAKGTPVMTPTGSRPIEELKSGDLVLARDENNLEGPVESRPVEQSLRGEAEIIELALGGRLVRTTGPHPFFVRGRGWTPAAELIPGDLLSTDAGGWVPLQSRRATGEMEPVFNVRVAIDHTYFIGGEDWGFGVWVHNSYGDEIILDRPFHVFIRDNVTSTILFMGRISDPTQLQNEVKPTVVDVNADFNGNALVDGADFLVWQRGKGTASGATSSQGDSDQDGDVDATDLAHWSTSYGKTEVVASNAVPLVASQSPVVNAPSDRRLPTELIDAAMAAQMCVVEQRENEPMTLSSIASLAPTVAESAAAVDEAVGSEARLSDDARHLSESESTPAEDEIGAASIGAALASGLNSF